MADHPTSDQATESNVTNESDLADDLLKGASEIAAFLGETERAVYHLSDKGSIPTFRLPGSRTLYARKSELRRTFSAAA